MKTKLFILFLLMVLTVSELNSQPYDLYKDFNCEPIAIIPEEQNQILFGGRYKPERTDFYPGTYNESVFRILIVFVQFDKDETYFNNIDWPAQGAPEYIDHLLAEDKNTNYGDEWWNAYDESTQTISDYFMEVSRGKFHVVGKCINIILPHDSTYYQQTGKKVEEINTDLYDLLKDNTEIYWPLYDNWTFENNTFRYARDYKN